MARQICERMLKFRRMKTLYMFYQEVLEPLGLKYVYHMTHADNLVPIFFTDRLYPHGNPYQVRDISDKDVNDRRKRYDPIFYRPIHSYVPFYFNPKNSMLYKRRGEQDNIVIFAMNIEIVLIEGSIFTDGNASSFSTEFFEDPWDLHKLDWDCINAETWYDKEDCKRKRMAEVLVPDCVPLNKVEKIICNNEETKSRVEEILKEAEGPIMHKYPAKDPKKFPNLYTVLKKEVECVVDKSFYFSDFSDLRYDQSEALLEESFFPF